MSLEAERTPSTADQNRNPKIDVTKIIPLITGGGSGIGLGLVEEFIKRGSPKIIITGRRESVLREVAEKYPQHNIHYYVSDAGNAADRTNLFEWITQQHPDCNALINNAGIQRRVAPVNDEDATWEERQAEIDINLSGPVHLCSLFIPYFVQKCKRDKVQGEEEEEGMKCFIVNVSSGLAFIPFAAGPVYSATKAALHNYTMAIRYSLQDTNVRVIEIVPPAVKSNLGGSHDFGEECDEFCHAVMDRIVIDGEEEVGYKFAENARLADRKTLDGMMNTVAEMMKVPKYPPSGD